jgi:hypothetical protein
MPCHLQIARQQLGIVRYAGGASSSVAVAKAHTSARLTHCQHKELYQSIVQIRRLFYRFKPLPLLSAHKLNTGSCAGTGSRRELYSVPISA